MAALPPMEVASPCRLNGTIGVYCQESPSTKLSPEVAENPEVQAPEASRGWMKPLALSYRLCQSCARLASVLWSAVSPSAPASAESAKSAESYSSVVEAGP